jgi:hypothetical protein
VGMVATDNIRTTTSTRNCSDDTMSPFSWQIDDVCILTSGTNTIRFVWIVELPTWWDDDGVSCDLFAILSSSQLRCLTNDFRILLLV